MNNNFNSDAHDDDLKHNDHSIAASNTYSLKSKHLMLNNNNYKMELEKNTKKEFVPPDGGCQVSN